MPDVHFGKGATVGSVIPTRGAVIPAAVGVDIGCGMMAVRTSLSAADLPESIKELRSKIERAVPHGYSSRGGRNDRGSWGEAPQAVTQAWSGLSADYDTITQKHEVIARGKEPFRQLGTLGSGNHFVEVCLDEAERVWFMLHSGSRGVGNKIGRYFIEDVWVTRKGAVRARKGDLGIIPGSMGAKSYIVAGKGNPESFHSCSHGAGRVMSRTAARAKFSLEDHALATAGIECRKDSGVLDETPAAYKAIEAVMAAQQDLVEVVHTLRQIVCVKG